MTEVGATSETSGAQSRRPLVRTRQHLTRYLAPMDLQLAMRICDALLTLTAPELRARYWSVVVDPAAHAVTGNLTPWGRQAIDEAERDIAEWLAMLWRRSDPEIRALLLTSDDPAVREAAMTGVALHAREVRCWG